MSADIISPVFTALCIIWPLVWVVWSVRRAERVFRTWLEQNRYQLLTRRSDRPGGKQRSPFWGKVPLSQVVYSIEILDERGAKHTGWIMIGNAMLGPATNRVDVRWDRDCSKH
jgi:hypothetical protein